MRIGDPAPDFLLPAVDGEVYDLKAFATKAILVVVFSCNHCPYVQAYEGRLIAVQRAYQDRGVQVLAINANDAACHPDDSFQAMVDRARRKQFNFPYLQDESQAVARSYAATHTPQLFVFDRDRRLAYTGIIDDNWQQPTAVLRPYLREALDALLDGRRPAEPMTHAIGCTIKWREG